MGWLTQFSIDRPKPKQRVGTRVKTLYSPEFDKQGRMNLVESGKEDLYGYIQSHKDSVDIHVLLSRYQNGDVNALSRAQGFYADLTGMPKTYAEMLQRISDGRQMFDSLPAEVRARFGSDFNQFMAAMDSPDFYRLLTADGSGNDTPKEVVKEVAENES